MLPTRARRLSAPKLTAEISDVVDRVVGKTDTLQTRFCKRFGVAAPIVVAPIGPELVAAVSNGRRLWNFASTIVPPSVATRSDHISAHPN